MTVQIVVSLKARDPIALTAKQAITRKMGVKALAGIRRFELWELSYESGTAKKAKELT